MSKPAEHPIYQPECSSFGLGTEPFDVNARVSNASSSRGWKVLAGSRHVAVAGRSGYISEDTKITLNKLLSEEERSFLLLMDPLQITDAFVIHGA